MASPSGSEQLSQLLQSLESLVSIHLNTAREVRRFTGGTLPDQVRSIWQDYLVRLRRLEGLIAGTLPECATTIRPTLPSSHPVPPAPKIDDAEHERRLLRLILFETVKADVADPGQDLVALRAVAVRCKGPLDGLWGCKVQRSGRSTFILLAKGRALVRRLREASGDGARGMRETVASMPDVAPLLTRGAYSLDAQSSLSVIMWDDESQVGAQVGGLDSAGTIGRLFARIGQGLLQSASLGPQLQADQEAAASPFVLIVKPALQESEVCLFDHQGEVWGLVISKDEPPDEGYRTEAPLTHQPIDGLLLRKQATRVVVVPRRSLEAANLSCLSLKRSPARAEAPAASLPPMPPSPAAAAPSRQAVPQAHVSAWPPPVQQPAALGAVMAQAAVLPAAAAAAAAAAQKPVPDAAAAQAFVGYATSRAGTGSQGQSYPTMAYPGPSYQQLPPQAAYTVQQQQSVSTALPAVSLQGRATSSTTGGKKRPAPIITQQQPALPAGSAGATSTPVGTQRAGTTPTSSSSAASSAAGRLAGLALPLAMQQQPSGMFVLLSPAQPVMQHLLETVWRFKPWVDGAKAGEGGGGEAGRRLASFLEQEPSVSKVVVLAGPAVPETGELHLDGASEPGGSRLSYESFRSVWVSSASFRTGSARCLLVVDADFSGVWVERLQQEGQDVRLAVQAACGAQQRRASAPPSFLDLLADFNRATSEAEEKAWRAQLSRLAHSGHLPCAFVQGAASGQKTYSFTSPRVRLMGASLIEEEQQSPTRGGSPADDVCDKSRPAEGGSAVQLDPGASAFLEFAMTAHQLQPSSPPLGPDGATSTGTSSGSPTTSTTKPGRKRKASAESSSSSSPSSASGVSKAPRTTSSPSRSSAAGTDKKRGEAEKGGAAAEGKGGAKAVAKGAKKKGKAGRQGGGDCGQDSVAMDEGEGHEQHGDTGLMAEGGHDCDGGEDGGTKSPVGSEQSSTARSDTTDSRLGHRESGESDEGDEEEEQQLDGPAGEAGRDVGLEQLWHGHKQDLFAYLLKTCPPGTFAVPSLEALFAEVEDANRRFNGGRPFDAHEFRAQLEQAGGSSQAVPLLEVLKGEERASPQVLKKMGGGRAWALWFLTRGGRHDFPTRQELHRIQEFLKRHKCYDPLEKALRRGQKTKLSRRLHEACPFLFLDDKLDTHLQHMRNLPEHDRALMQKQVLDVVGRFSRTEVWAVLQALESGVLLYVQGKAWPNTGLMAYWTETNGAWQLAEHLSGIRFSRQGETIYRGDATAGLIEQQHQQQQQQQDYKNSPQPQERLLQPPALIPIEPVASNIEMVDAATQAQSPQQQQRQLMSLPAGPQQQQPPSSHQQQQERDVAVVHQQQEAGTN